MKNKKLRIEDLSVKSFITAANEIRGGLARVISEEQEVSGGGGGFCGTEDVGCEESNHNCFGA
ncbi:pinensin family lanthipeptide [Roseivirga sp. BDSF3-8]|uniref:pinensin family lanthipeptide n=1 Tax=Roseivirga sp. BDSF3-8 TaxID=3241598 RepID=UPI0035326CC4